MNTKPFAALMMAVALTACSDSTGPSSGTSISLTYSSGLASVALQSVGAATAPMRAEVTDGTNTLVISEIRMVLRRIDLKNAETADCDVEPEPLGCENFRSDPILVNLPVDGSTSGDLTVTVPEGRYDELEFDIHEVTGRDDDADFLAAHPEMEGKSIAVSGTYNGEPFEFETNMSTEQKFALEPALVIGAGGAATNVTLRFDVSTWFRDEQGNLFNPATATTGEPNESVAEENIQNSAKAFEDRDRDGDETDEG